MPSIRISRLPSRAARRYPLAFIPAGKVIHMASIRKEIIVAAGAAHVWDAVRDVGAIHERLVPGFVTDCRMEGSDARMVTFANGMTVRELIVDLDDSQRRIAWSARGGRLTHHNASLQVFEQGDGSARLLWIADLLPGEMAPAIAGMIDQGLAAMGRTFNRR
jgi:carbon monoxide dehydrogenase subunit G